MNDPRFDYDIDPVRLAQFGPDCRMSGEGVTSNFPWPENASAACPGCSNLVKVTVPNSSARTEDGENGVTTSYLAYYFTHSAGVKYLPKEVNHEVQCPVCNGSSIVARSRDWATCRDCGHGDMRGPFTACDESCESCEALFIVEPPAPHTLPRVDILCDRDSDGGTEFTFFINGVEFKPDSHNIHVHTLDYGRGEDHSTFCNMHIEDEDVPAAVHERAHSIAKAYHSCTVGCACENHPDGTCHNLS